MLIAVPAIVIILALIFWNKPSEQSYGDNIAEIDWSNATETTLNLEKTTKITSSGVYRLTGEISNGYLEINTSGAVKLILAGVNITNSTGPAIYVAEAKSLTVSTEEGTTNTLTDASTYQSWDEDVCGALFSHDDLILEGSGTLIVNGNFEDGIVGKDDLKVSSGTIIINSKDDGLRGRDSVYIAGGNLTINSGGDAIKSNNTEEKGYILIDDGALSLSADDDGVHAESLLEINGGTIDIKKSYEGLEAAKISINGGTIKVVSSDDGLNAAGGNDSSSPNVMNYRTQSGDYSITINGGEIYVNSQGDGIDSNGLLYLNGGTVVVDGPSNSANGALDAETGIIYNGGTAIAVGASGMAVAPNNSSTKYSLSVFFTSTYSAKTTLTVKDSSGSVVLSHTSTRTFNHASLSSESFKEGETYTILINDSVYETVTLSDKTTTVGSGGMFPGGFPAQNGGQGGGAQGAQNDRFRR